MRMARHLLTSTLIALLVGPLGYALVGFGLGAWPVAGAAPPSEAEAAVEVFIASNGYHASLILPVRGVDMNWLDRHPARHFRAPPPNASHIGFGWGDRRFYMETRTLGEVRPATAWNALFGGGATVVHVQLWPRPAAGRDVRRILASPRQVALLAAHIQETFAADQPVPHVDSGFGGGDVFYPARGRYGPIETCNEWVSRGLRRAGILTGVWTPFAISILWHGR